MIRLVRRKSSLGSRPLLFGATVVAPLGSRAYCVGRAVGRAVLPFLCDRPGSRRGSGFGATARALLGLRAYSDCVHTRGRTAALRLREGGTFSDDVPACCQTARDFLLGCACLDS